MASNNEDRDVHGNWKPQPRFGIGWVRVLRHQEGANDAEFYDPDGGHEDEHTTEDGIWLSLAPEAQAARREAAAVEVEAFVRGGNFDDTDCGEAIADAVLRVLGLSA